MASTNKTTNYELSQFVETDKPAWLTDYNGDMRKLDTALKAVSDVADGASGGISSLTDRMTAAEGAITTNANDIDVLEARADALEAQAQSTSGTIANIQTEQTAQNLGIEAATELGYNLARPYDSASTYAVGAYVLFQNTLYKCVTAVSTGEAFDPTKWLAIKATDEISAGGYTLPIAGASQLGGIMVGSGLSIDPLTGVLSASMPQATNEILGAIKVGGGLNIENATGLLNVNKAITYPSVSCITANYGIRNTHAIAVLCGNIKILTVKSLFYVAGVSQSSYPFDLQLTLDQRVEPQDYLDKQYFTSDFSIYGEYTGGARAEGILKRQDDNWIIHMNIVSPNPFSPSTGTPGYNYFNIVFIYE